MARLTDREAFERDIFKPPFLARMLERCGEYTGALDKADSDALKQLALDAFWDLREKIHNSNDVMRVWEEALSRAARSRPRWQVWFNVYQSKWVKGSRLGRD